MHITLFIVALLSSVSAVRKPHTFSDETFHYEEEEVMYKAAVLELKPYSNMADGGLAVLKENARIFIEYAVDAKQQGADIIVFPEYGLTGNGQVQDLSEFMSLTQAVPDPINNTILCNSSETLDAIQAVRDLSCAAAELQIYLVVNLAEQVPCNTKSSGGKDQEVVEEKEVGGRGGEVEEEMENGGRAKHEEEAPRECLDSGFFVYNAEVVFDRSGAVVAKYRKKKLYLEPGFTPGTEDDEEAIFTTDFGVTFSLQVCFDIIHLSPGTSNVVKRGVTDVIMSSYWVDELPFLTAPQMWQSWSRGLSVNLLVANYHQPEGGAVGSGIFRGLTSRESLYTYDPSGGPKLLVGEVVSRRSRGYDLGTRKVTTIINVIGEESEEERMESNARVEGDDSKATEEKGEDVEINKARKDSSGILEDEGMEITINKSDARKEDNKTNGEKEEEDDNNIRKNNKERGTSKEATTTPSKMKTQDENPGGKQFIIHENLENYTSSILERGNNLMIKTLCHNDSLCCTAAYTFPLEDTDYEYLLFAYSGIVLKGGGTYPMFTQVCAIVYCLEADVYSCANVDGPTTRNTTFRAKNLTGSFDTRFVYPSVFTQGFELFPETEWDFDLTYQNDSTTHASVVVLGEINDLLSLRLFGRWFERDPQ